MAADLAIKRVLVPTDFSPYSLKALRYARAFAQQTGARLTLLHVIDPGIFVYPDDAYHVPNIPSQQEIFAVADQRLKRLVADELPGETADGVVRFGNPAVEIVRYAHDEDFDLIAIATHGRTGLAHLFMGSVTEKVVRKAPCPVLVVKDPEHEFVRP